MSTITETELRKWAFLGDSPVFFQRGEHHSFYFENGDLFVNGDNTSTPEGQGRILNVHHSRFGSIEAFLKEAFRVKRKFVILD